ncbi:MAG: protein-tyrosine-phosphatase [Aureliella sp.]
MPLRKILFTLGAVFALTIHAPAAERLYPEVERYVQQRLAEVDQIPAERREQLRKLSQYIADHRAAGKPVRLLFVCTHNSRRSHFAQVWAQVGAAHFGLDNVKTYSGGTEATAMNSRTVAALKRAGLKTSTDDPSSNPKYVVAMASNLEPLVCFSKTLAEPPNPTEQFAAIMTCSSADAACPTVQGAELRLAVTYDDPKASDGTAEEAATYDERSRQIAREMIFVMSQVARG